MYHNFNEHKILLCQYFVTPTHLLDKETVEIGHSMYSSFKYVEILIPDWLPIGESHPELIYWPGKSGTNCARCLAS